MKIQIHDVTIWNKNINIFLNKSNFKSCMWWTVTELHVLYLLYGKGSSIHGFG